MLLQDWQDWIFRKKVIKGYFKARLCAVGLLLLLICLGIGIYQSFKVLPEGLDYQSQPYIVNLSDIDFLQDLTFSDAKGQRQTQQEIFNTVFNYIDSAQQYILIDMFLFNDFTGSDGQVYKKLSSQLTDKLIAKKRANSDIRINLIVDPINTVYGGFDSAQLRALSEAGINVVVTDLKPLRDGNPIYSAPWRLFFSYWGNSLHGYLPQPFSAKAKKVSLRSYLAMLNFKANHRKTFLFDKDGELVSLVASANAHDASSAHSNVALLVRGVFGQELFKSESAVAVMSKNSLEPLPPNLLNPKAGQNQYAKVSLITEGQIRQTVLGEINKLNEGDHLFLAMFYLSERQVVKALLAASKRGVDVRLILDPNKDAFGYEKNGIPNRQVADELIKKSNNKIAVRWYQTSGEQFHSKLMLAINEQEGILSLVLGSANFTRRNIGDYNLETDIWLSTKRGLNLAQEFEDYFNKLWTNSDGNVYTVDYKTYQDESLINNLFYRFQEFTGLSSF